MRRTLYFIIFLSVIWTANIKSQSPETIQNGIIDYLGQTPPGDSAIVLTTDLIPKDYNIFGIVLSPLDDELFLTIYKGNSGTILHSKRIGFCLV